MKLEITKKYGMVSRMVLEDGDDSGGGYQVTIGDDYAASAVSSIAGVLDDVVAVKHVGIWDDIAPRNLYNGKYHPTRLAAIKAFEKQATKIIRDAAKKLREELEKK